MQQAPTKRILPTILLAAAAIYLYKKIRLAKNAFVEDISLKLNNTSLADPKFIAQFTINNPTYSQAKFNGVYGKIELQGKPVADVFYNNPVEIIPNGRTRIDIEVFPTWAGILTTLVSLIKNRGLNNLYFNGQMNVDGFALPLNINLSNA